MSGQIQLFTNNAVPLTPFMKLGKPIIDKLSAESAGYWGRTKSAR